jgi:excisionase family DNA binding protein
MKVLTTQEAAELKGVSVRRIQQLIKDGALTAKKVGRDYTILEKDLNKVKVYGKVGRPRKQPEQPRKAA